MIRFGRRHAKPRWLPRALAAASLLAGLLSNPMTQATALPSVAPGAMQVAVSTSGACALDVEGHIWCWGGSASGFPVRLDTEQGFPAAAPTDYQHLSAGPNHFCAIAVDDTAWCWGSNSSGNLGDGTSVQQQWPTAVDTSGSRPDTYAWISAGGSTKDATLFTCGVSGSDGSAWCWGSDAQGQLGSTASNDPPGTCSFGAPCAVRPVPVDTTSARPDSYSMVAAGDRTTCGISADAAGPGTAWCWGDDEAGELGNGEGGIDRGQLLTIPADPDASSPVAVDVSGSLPDTYEWLSGGREHFCGIDAVSHAAWCWGSNDNGYLGWSDNYSTQYPYAWMGYHPSPVPVDTSGTRPDAYASLAANGSHTCGLARDDGAVFCWGVDSYGEVGDGGPPNPNPPLAMAPVAVDSSEGRPSTYAQIAVGPSTSCGLTGDGYLWCWGRGDQGQLGQGEPYYADMYFEVSPVEVFDWPPTSSPTAPGFMQVAVSYARTCALTEDGEIWCWGDGSATPARVSAPGAVFEHLSGGEFHFCALATDGAAWCWGDDLYGGLGNGASGSSATPVAVDTTDALPDAYLSISVGAAHTCAIATDASAWCWGRNLAGQLGDGTFTDRPSPVPVDTSEGRPATYGSITAGNPVTCGIDGSDASGSAWCWGGDAAGELGNGDSGSDGLSDGFFPAPVAVATGDGLPSFYRVLSAGPNHVCGIADDDTAWCWGWDGNGRLGDGLATLGGQYSFIPSPVDTGSSLPDFYLDIVASGPHGCGLAAPFSTAYCWGYNFYGQVGDGTTFAQGSPVPVVTTGSIPDVFAQIALGTRHTCATTSSGTIWCWGSNDFGQLGVSGSDRSTPVQVASWPPPAVFTLDVAFAGNGGGTVTSTPSGIECTEASATCSATFAPGTSVTLSALAADGSTFTGWTGEGCTGVGSCVVEMTAARSVTATFGLESFTLSASTAGGGTITSNIGGITCPPTCSASYETGTTVTLSANPAQDASFVSWSGCVPVGGTPTQCTVTMDAEKSASATFAYPLSVARSGTGTGTITSVPVGVNCGATCSASFDYGTSVTLSAVASSGSTFTGWTGEGCSGTGSCVVEMTAARSVTATFTLDTFGLTVGLAGAGAGWVSSLPVGISCPSTCTAEFGSGQSVVLSASAASGSSFTGWSGCDSTVGNECTVTVSGARSVSATFALDSFNVSVGRTGTGLGSVVSVPAAIVCPPTCTTTFLFSTSVTFTATPAIDAVFGGWLGCDSSEGFTCTVLVSESTEVTAIFDRAFVPLTVVVSGGGQVDAEPAAIDGCIATCTAPFEYGSEVLLTATPDEGYLFAGWSSNCAPLDGLPDQCAVTATAAKTVGAFFVAAGDTLALAAGGPESASTGGLIPFSIAIGNFGNADLPSTTLKVETSLVVTTLGCTESPTDVWTCALPTLAADATRRFTVFALAPTTEGTASATFTVSAATTPVGEDPSNNVATVTVPIDGDLVALRLAASPQVATEGTLLSYALDVRNGSSTTPVTGLVLHVGFDADGLLLPAAGGCTVDPTPAAGFLESVSCGLADLGPSVPRTVQFQAYAPSAATSFDLEATFWITYSEDPIDAANDIAGPTVTAIDPLPDTGEASSEQTFDAPTIESTQLSTVPIAGLTQTDQTGIDLSLPGGFLGTASVGDVLETPGPALLAAPLAGGRKGTLARPIKTPPAPFSCTVASVYDAECWRFDISIVQALDTRFTYTFTFRFDGSAFADAGGRLLRIRQVLFFHQGDGEASYTQVPSCPRGTTVANYMDYMGTGPCLLSKSVDRATGDYLFVVLTDRNGQWKGGR